MRMHGETSGIAPEVLRTRDPGECGQVLVPEREQLEALVDRDPRVRYRPMGTIVRAAHRVQARQWMQASELGDHISKQRERY